MFLVRRAASRQRRGLGIGPRGRALGQLGAELGGDLAELLVGQGTHRLFQDVDLVEDRAGMTVWSAAGFDGRM